MLANYVAIQKGDRPSAHLQEHVHENVGNGGLAGPRQPGEENSQPLSMARGIAAAQFMNDLWIRKPSGNITSFVQPLAQFGPRDVQYSRTITDFIVGDIFVQIFEVDQHIE